MTKIEKAMLAKAKKRFFENPTVTSVSFGYRYTAKKKIGDTSLVVGVQKKMAESRLASRLILPKKFDGVPTDVQERDVYAIPPEPLKTTPFSYTGKKRPCPPGFSIGHYLITAGTLGAWVKRGSSDDYLILSNNHVLANSNDAKVNDEIRQPGKYDGGTADDLLARLDAWVKINFGDDDKKKKAARFLWKLWQAPANGLARLVGCPYRMTVSTHAIEQPNPNLVDCALARPVLQSYVDTEVYGIGEIAGIRDLQLGDRVQKAGRTTERTIGTVEGVGAMVRVNYGSGKMATYDDQLEIRADSGEFSAGGDSGSAILTTDDEPYLGGLLFAGGSGVTIANRISDVVALLGIRL